MKRQMQQLPLLALLVCCCGVCALEVSTMSPRSEHVEAITDPIESLSPPATQDLGDEVGQHLAARRRRVSRRRRDCAQTVRDNLRKIVDVQAGMREKLAAYNAEAKGISGFLLNMQTAVRKAEVGAKAFDAGIAVYTMLRGVQLTHERNFRMMVAGQEKAAAQQKNAAEAQNKMIAHFSHLAKGSFLQSMYYSRFINMHTFLRNAIITKANHFTAQRNTFTKMAASSKLLAANFDKTRARMAESKKKYIASIHAGVRDCTLPANADPIQVEQKIRKCQQAGMSALQRIKGYMKTATGEFLKEVNFAVYLLNIFGTALDRFKPKFVKLKTAYSALQSEERSSNKCNVDLPTKADSAIKEFKDSAGTTICIVDKDGKIPEGKYHLYCVSPSVQTKVQVRTCATNSDALVMVKHDSSASVSFREPNGVEQSVLLSYVKVAVCLPRSSKDGPRACSVRKITYGCKSGKQHCSDHASATSAMSV